jgi:hypothetical protein
MKNSIEKYIDTIKDINLTINYLFEQSDDGIKSDIDEIKDEISYLRNLFYEKQKINIDFDKITIRFLGEYELKLPKYGVESFDRTLKGEMYFKVLGGSKKYIDIKTNSFPNTFKIRLFYKTLKEYTTQTEEGYLIYERGTEFLVGEEVKMNFIIIKKS